MKLIDACCTVCGQEEGTFPGMKEAERVLRAYGWVRCPPAELWNGLGWDATPSGGNWVWYCTHCANRTLPWSIPPALPWDVRKQACERRRAS